MLDPERDQAPAQPSTDHESVAPVDAPTDAVGSGPPVQPPTWTKTYELPTARKVVSAGLQLAVAAARPIRGASIYIGLLALGAFGPTIILLFAVIARLGSPAAAVDLILDPAAIIAEHPELQQPLELLFVLLLVGFLLLLAISIDAQAIAIALLGGVAAGRPLRLAEAVTRARQSFWRLVSAGIIVGLVSAIVSWAITIPFSRPFESNEAIGLVGSIVSALIVSPWAFAATGIVLGDVRAVEALKRSNQLFRARPRVALVVVLFTLVTAAIQAFALGAGLEAAVRVAEALGIGRGEGPTSLILPAMFVLALVVAFGSLTFTIAAIVAAPQVAAFLGMTFYSGGLDRARSDADGKRGVLQWVAPPMVIAIVLLALIAAVAVAQLAR